MKNIVLKPKLPKHNIFIKKQRRFLILEIYKKNDLFLFFYSNNFILDDLYDILKYLNNYNNMNDITNKLIKLFNNNKIKFT